MSHLNCFEPYRQHVWENQLNPDLPEEATLGFPEGACPRDLPWREMILALTNLRDQERFDPTAAALVDECLSCLPTARSLHEGYLV